MAGKHDEVKIQIKTLLDPLGAEQAKKLLKELQKEAEDAGGKGAGAMGKFASGVRGLTSAMGALKAAFAGAGVLALAAQVAGLVAKIQEAIGARKRMAEDIQAGNAEAGVNRIKEAYDKLKESISAANGEIKAGAELEDMRLGNARKLEDAQLKLAEEREVEALDAADPDRAEKERAVRARYALRRGALAGGRSKEDITREAERKEAEAARAEEEAAAIGGRISEMGAMARDYSGRAAGAQKMMDQRSWFGVKGMNWHGGESRAHAQGKELHEFYSGRFQQVAGQMQGAEADRGAALARAARLREEAGIIRERQEAAEAEEEADTVVNKRGVAEADAGVRLKEDEREEARAAAGRVRRLKETERSLRADAARKQTAAEEKRLDLDRFDRKHEGTTNTTMRDQKRAPLERDAKSAAADSDKAMRALQEFLATSAPLMRETAATAQRLTREMAQMRSRQHASMADAAGD